MHCLTPRLSSGTSHKLVPDSSIEEGFSPDTLKLLEGMGHTIAEKATDPTTAFDLYASRYWALRSMFETELDIESPIQDPDRRIEMLLDSGIEDIQAHIADSEIPRARLRGIGLESPQLCWLYNRAASEFHEKLEALS